MSQNRPASKRNRRRRAAPPPGSRGLSLSLAGGAAAAVGQPLAETAARNAPVTQEITLAEDEISGVSLATFHVFDKENAAKIHAWLRAAVPVARAAGVAAVAGQGLIIRRRSSATAAMISRIRSSRRANMRTHPGASRDNRPDGISGRGGRHQARARSVRRRQRFGWENNYVTTLHPSIRSPVRPRSRWRDERAPGNSGRY